MTDCAALLGTSRRRYRAIERGEIGVEVAELEVLADYLGIPLRAIWKDANGQAVRRVVKLQPGEIVHVLAVEPLAHDG